MLLPLTPRLAVLVLAVLGMCLPAGPVQAQMSGGTIEQIRVEGTLRIEPATVQSYMLVQPGDRFDAERIDQSLKTLFETQLFADVTMRRQGNTLVVQVVENPVINRLVFEGNSRIEDDELEPEVQLGPRAIYTRAKVQQDTQRIIDIYRRSGRYAVTVEPKVIQRPQNRVDLVFEITEGRPTYIRRISFIGNERYSDSQLRTELISKEERWYRFFSATDTYDPERLNFDRELLRRYYVNNGFADFQVLSAVAEMAPDREGFFITFTVEEGQRYSVGDIAITTTLPELDPDQLAAETELEIETADWYDASAVEDTVLALTEAVGARGFAFVDIRPQLTRRGDAPIIDIVFEVNEGPRVFVERIEIRGNVRTLDEVVRREFLLAEGDAFNSARLRRSRQRIEGLNFFSSVEVETLPSETAPDRTVIAVDVEEQATGELTFGVGWSTGSGALVEAQIRERNLLGRGQDLALSGALAQRQSQIDLSFTEPYFLDRNLAAGFDVFSVTRDLQGQSSFDSETVGGAIRLGWRYSERLSQSARYTIRTNRVTNVAADASEFIQQQAGSELLSAISQSLLYDRRDRRIEATEGYFVRFSNDLAGVGGDSRFLRTGLLAGQFFTLQDEWILALQAEGGYVFGIGDDIAINERYFLGGDSLRGFENAGVSPRDSETRDALGSNWQVRASAELTFPIGLPEELGITGKLFTDVGTMGKFDNFESDEVLYDVTPRLTIGTGLNWRSPVGPISIDLGLPVMRQDYDQTESFRLNFGTRF